MIVSKSELEVLILNTHSYKITTMNDAAYHSSKLLEGFIKTANIERDEKVENNN